jgi:hypothetical protein
VVSLKCWSFVEGRDDNELGTLGGKSAILDVMEQALHATSEFYISHTPIGGIPY